MDTEITMLNHRNAMTFLPFYV
jgi:hypothetical protein